MRYPMLLLIPVMMLADYYLTILGAVAKEKRYALHFRMPHYEMNPIWQASVARKRWFNPRHLLLTIVLSAGLIFIAETGDLSEELVDGFAGTVLVLYGMMLGRHLANLGIFGHLNRHPEALSGELAVSHSFALVQSLYQCLVAVVPVALIAMVSRNAFAVGGVMGLALFMGVNLSWLGKARRQERAAERKRSRAEG